MAIGNTTESQMMNGADILVKSLVDHGVEVLFAYPGGCSMPLHQALTRYSDRLRTILPRHEQGGAFAAQGYARSTGKVGVCMATSGPGATNLVTAIADAKLVRNIFLSHRDMHQRVAFIQKVVVTAINVPPYRFDIIGGEVLDESDGPVAFIIGFDFFIGQVIVHTV